MDERHKEYSKIEEEVFLTRLVQLRELQTFLVIHILMGERAKAIRNKGKGCLEQRCLRFWLSGIFLGCL